MSTDIGSLPLCEELLPPDSRSPSTGSGWMSTGADTLSADIGTMSPDTESMSVDRESRPACSESMSTDRETMSACSSALSARRGATSLDIRAMSLDRGAMSACIQTVSTDIESMPAYITALSARRETLQGDSGPCKSARIRCPPALNESAEPRGWFSPPQLGESWPQPRPGCSRGRSPASRPSPRWRRGFPAAPFVSLGYNDRPNPSRRGG